MVNTPIPASLRSEAKKAAKILSEFTESNGNLGLDTTIPDPSRLAWFRTKVVPCTAGLLVRARGLAILTVVKVGFLVTARAGSGIVIARTGAGGWSAPSAIGIAGLGGGLELGAEVTDFVIILNSQSAIDAFAKGGNLTLGGNFTVAAGPVGRNLEGDVVMKGHAAIYTYSRTKGLFAGISLEGSYLIERKDSNAKFYGEPVRAMDLLSGTIPAPDECSSLYDVLHRQESAARQILIDKAKHEGVRCAQRKLNEKGVSGSFMDRFDPKSSSTRNNGRRGSVPDERAKEADRKLSAPNVCVKASASVPSFFRKSLKKPSSKSSKERPTPPSALRVDYGSTAVTDLDTWTNAQSWRERRRGSDPWRGGGDWDSGYGENNVDECFTPVTEVDWTTTSESSRAAVFRVRCAYSYKATLTSDLTFDVGDVIEVLTPTDTWDDWWEGRLRGKVGIFPANYTEIT